ncbi:hypothetical protein GCM10010272_66390 [Streptomyces lateritius]|nr:hypothetical protein GCM10010272_66390 [Streptomyces lateritius]
MANTNDGSPPHGRAAGSAGAGPSSRRTWPLAQQLYDVREKTDQQFADLFGLPRSTVYRHLDKTKTVPRQPEKTTATKPLPLLCAWGQR